jgi:surfeit locus 1 family protein
MRLPLLPTLFTLVSIVILCGLGFWQLERLEWKTRLITDMQQQLTQPPFDLDASSEARPDLNYRQVKLTGRFIDFGELHLLSRVHDGQVGIHAVEFFRQENGDIWLVNRGWVAPEAIRQLPYRGACDYSASLPCRAQGDPVTLTAIARQPRVPDRFTPPNNPSENQWYFYEPEAMFRTAEVASLPLMQELLASARHDYVLEATADQSVGPYKAGVTRLDIPNNHLVYALTWFALAFTLAGVYGFFLRSLYRRQLS